MRSGKLCIPAAAGRSRMSSSTPPIPGRLYSVSDVDGFYRSNDYGLSFESLNEGIHTDAVSTLEVDPSDSDRLFLGTARGVLRSTDGGDSWAPMAGSEAVPGGNDGKQLGIHVSTLTVDPSEPDRVYFANSWGWKHTYSFYWNNFGFNQTGDIIHPGQVYVTDDGGDSWDIVTFEPNAGYMDVYSIEVNPVASNEVYIAAHPGIYKSTDYGRTWDKLPTPASAFYSRGVAVTPDGEFLVASFTTEALPAYTGDKTPIADSTNNKGNPNATIYTSPVQNGIQATWLQRDIGLPQLEGSEGGPPATEYWRPKVDPRSNASDGYDVLVGTMLGRQGLYRTRFFPDGSNNLDDPQWERILWKEGLDGFSYDQGWDEVSVLSRFYQFTPISWGGDLRIWATAGQSLLEGNPAAGGWPTSAASWRTRSTERAGTAGPYDTYTTRGVQSSVNYDQAALGSYVVQAQVDNGIVESFDGGRTWLTEHQPSPGGVRPFSNARSVHVFDNVSPAVTLAAAGFGYGSGKGWTPLHSLISDAPDASTPWNIRVDAGLNGPKNDYVISIVPALPEAGSTSQGAYFAFQGAAGAAGGVHYHPDVEQLARGFGNFQQIAGADADSSLKKTSKLMAHPTDPAKLYRITRSSLFRMDRGADGVWTDTLLATGAKDFTVWGHAGSAYIAAGKRDRLLLSSDGGETFQTAWTVPPDVYGPWYGWLFEQTTPELSGFAARGETFYFGLGLRKNRKGIGYYRATLDGDGVVIEDWTGSGAGRLENPRSNDSAEILTIEGVDYVALPTRGSGLWVRPIGQAVASDPTLTPTEDAYTRGGSFRNDNFGSAGVLELSQGSGGVNKRIALVKFDLSGVQTPVTSATLRLYGSLSQSSSVGGINTQVFSSDANAWNEQTVTWNTRPGFGTNLAEFAVTGTADQWYEVDVTDYVNAETASSASFLIRNTTDFAGITVFSSKEGSQAPQLVLNSDPALRARSGGEAVVGVPYPNPATGRASVRLDLPQEVRVGARLYDVLGREVAVVPEETLSGEAVLSFDLSRLSPGLYLVRVQVGDEATVHRLTLTR